jgi:hypothetical protein
MKKISGGRIFFCLFAIAFIAGVLLLPRLTSSQGGEYRGQDVVTATGSGKISSQGTVSLGLARRAALSDARRNLLIEARRIREGVQGKPDISGYVGHHWIVSERTEGSFYRVTLAASLSSIRVD